LLILTDGSVSDMNATKRALIAASNAPLSIIVVGIGEADFGPMHQIDEFLDTKQSTRDIIHFLEFRQYQHDKRALVQATLEELPEQVVDYYIEKGIQPLPMANPNQFNIVPDAYDEDADVELKLSFTGDKDATLESGGIYNETNYRLPPPVPYQPVAPVAPHYQQPGAASAPYQPEAPAGSYGQRPPAPYQPVASPAPYQPAAPPAPFAQQPAVAATPYQPAARVQPRKFRVQVPPGVASGMQIQVQNPSTGQMMVLTVPHGVVTGQVFDVNYWCYWMSNAIQ